MISILMDQMTSTRFGIDCQDCQIRHKAICANSDADELAKLNSFKSYTRYQPDEMITYSGDPMDYVGTLVTGMAEISMAMDAARASADIILLNGRLDILPDVLKLSKVASLRMLQNFGLAALYNIITIPLAFSGFATPLMAALAMSLSSITVTLNAFRLPKINKGNAPDLFQPQQERAP